jgi:hypothetical protein
MILRCLHANKQYSKAPFDIPSSLAYNIRLEPSTRTMRRHHDRDIPAITESVELLLWMESRRTNGFHRHADDPLLRPHTHRHRLRTNSPLSHFRWRTLVVRAGNSPTHPTGSLLVLLEGELVRSDYADLHGCVHAARTGSNRPLLGRVPGRSYHVASGFLYRHDDSLRCGWRITHLRLLLPCEQNDPKGETNSQLVQQPSPALAGLLRFYVVVRRSSERVIFIPVFLAFFRS